MADHLDIERWPDDRLLREASNGNEAAFGVFCVRAIPGIRRYVRLQCKSFDIPNDLVGDFSSQTILRALTHVQACREHGNRPFPKVSFAWLRQIAYNVIIDWCRQSKRLVFMNDFDVEAPPLPCLEDIEEQEEILKFFTWLTDNERDMLEMVWVEELNVVEAGAKLGLSQWASYKAHQRAMAHLRDLLQEHGIIPIHTEL